jgi:hypothetical protein
MRKGQYDLGHYALYFVLFLFVCVFLFSYIIHLYSEKQIDVFRTSLTLEETFAVEKVLDCFSDSTGHFDVSLFTSSTLEGCDTRPVSVTFEPVSGEPLTIGIPDLKQDVVHKEYVALEQSGGVLTVVMEHI